jgi:hypothetical protein
MMICVTADLGLRSAASSRTACSVCASVSIARPISWARVWQRNLPGPSLFPGLRAYASLAPGLSCERTRRPYYPAIGTSSAAVLAAVDRSYALFTTYFLRGLNNAWHRYHSYE